MIDLRGQRGQALVEFTGTIWLILVAAVLAWQLALCGWTAVAAANAARTAAREYSRIQDQGQAESDAHGSLAGDGVNANSEVDFASGPDGGERVTVRAYIPIVFPGLASPVAVTQTATMPITN